ncbi:MAG: hypothetical protein JXA41_01815 [Deltaproteobacteria bacterium]|nr:hypothetical protein [Deltaproteobacteria bacterium]
MDNLIESLTHNPLVFMTAVLLVFLISYFIFKQLFKLFLLFLIILLAVGGYYYFKDPKAASENIRHVLTVVKDKTAHTVDKGKEAYETGKDLVGKAQDFNKSVDKLLGADKEKKPDEKSSPKEN